MILAVALLGGVGFLLVRWGPKRVRSSRNGLEVLTSLSLGRGVLYVVRCGTDVLLLAESKEGISLLRRYPADVWEKIDEAEPENSDPH
jgi:flagellar biogenesis protein FliO